MRKSRFSDHQILSILKQAEPCVSTSLQTAPDRFYL